MNETIIRWTDSSWNPISGCSKVSDGCRFCYAMTISLKFKQTSKPWTVQNEEENVVLKPHKLHEPYTLGTEPQRCFVNSMSDLFHRVVPDWYRAAVFCVMLDLPHIIFQTLTKRSEATIDWHERFLVAVRSDEFKAFAATVKHKKVQSALAKAETYTTPWGANIWQGVSVEDARVLNRIDDLRQCRAVVRFISAEPLLGAWGDAVDLSGIHWIIVGGESGKHINEHPERYMKQEWAREIKNLCVDQGVAYFYKQDSGHTTELRPYLTEADGNRWEWMQYPDAMSLPVRLSADGQRDEMNADGKDADYCLRQARHFEREAYTAPNNPIDAYWRDIAAMYAAYWYDAAARLRPALPVDPNAPSGWLLGGREVSQAEWDAYEQATGWNAPPLDAADDLEALRAGSDERIADTLAELVSDPDPDPIPSAPITKIEPDYADPFDLPLNAKVITLQQPYASAVMAGVKQIETRSWKTPYRGALVIHAGKAWNDDLKEKANSELIASALRSKGIDPNNLPLGMALGVVILDTVTPIENVLPSLSDTEKALGHYTDGNFAWCVSRPRLFREPLAGEGGLGLRDWSSYLAKFKDAPSPNQPDEPPPALFIDQFVIVPGKDPALYRGRIKKLANGEAMIAFNQQGDWIPYAEVQPHPDAVTTVHTARVDSRDPDVIDITVKSASTDIGKFFAPTWDMVNGVKSGKISEAQYTAMYEELLRGRYTTSASMLSNFLWERRRVVFTCYCAAGEFCHRYLAVNVLAKIGMKFGFTVVNGGELEPPKPEAPSVQMSLFEDEVPAKKKTVYA